MQLHTIFELRNYTLHTGRRDAFIQLFETEFIESQEMLGMRVIGTFRTLGDLEHFVWIRSFADMPARAAALNAFYSGPVWKAHREVANAAMVDSDDVHLLHPVGAPLALPAKRALVGAKDISRSVFVVSIYANEVETERNFSRYASDEPNLIGVFATERTENNFPRLPVKSENVFVVLHRFETEAAQEFSAAKPSRRPPPMQVLRLQPSARSLLR